MWYKFWRWIPGSIACGLIVAAILSPFLGYFQWLPILIGCAAIMVAFTGGDGL